MSETNGKVESEDGLATSDVDELVERLIAEPAPKRRGTSAKAIESTAGTLGLIAQLQETMKPFNALNSVMEQHHKNWGSFRLFPRQSAFTKLESYVLHSNALDAIANLNSPLNALTKQFDTSPISKAIDSITMPTIKMDSLRESLKSQGLHRESLSVALKPIKSHTTIIVEEMREQTRALRDQHALQQQVLGEQNLELRQANQHLGSISSQALEAQNRAEIEAGELRIERDEARKDRDRADKRSVWSLVVAVAGLLLGAYAVFRASPSMSAPTKTQVAPLTAAPQVATPKRTERDTVRQIHP